MYELLFRLKKSGIGWNIGNVFVAALAYADVVTLIYPTLMKLEMVIRICEDYASEYNVAFNGNKSKLIFFKGNEACECVCKCEWQYNWVWNRNWSFGA